MKKNRLPMGLAFLLLVLMGMNFYFQSYYFPGSKIDGRDVSWQQRTKEHLEALPGGFTLKSGDLHVEYTLLSESLSLSYTRPQTQSFSLRPIKFSSKKSIAYDENQLKRELRAVLKELPENRKSEDAKLYIEDGKLILEPQIIGYEFPSEEDFLKIINSAMTRGEFNWNLDQYLVKPEILTRDLRPEYNFLRKYGLRNKDYDWTLEGEELYKLFNRDLSLNEDRVKKAMESYFDEADSYSTIWMVDQKESLPDFIDALKNRKKSWEASYVRVRKSPDNSMYTGIMVSLERQWLWVFSGGSEIFQAPIVSGNPNRGYSTHRGYWSILNKATNTRLANTNREGYSYDVPVSYWMQFNNEGMIEGFHDATWHWAFGTDVFLWDGSHGCVNLSVGDMATLYSISWVGMPVWVY